MDVKMQESFRMIYRWHIPEWMESGVPLSGVKPGRLRAEQTVLQPDSNSTTLWDTTPTSQLDISAGDNGWQ